MKYLFFVQNEGRGHLTQSLTVAGELRLKGHEIVGVVLSDNPNRQTPAFFKEQINTPLYSVKSPYFLKNKQQTGVDLPKSVIFNLFRSLAYLSSIIKIKKLCSTLKPDVILNFYEPTIGLSHFFYKNLPITYSFGHQFFLDHAAFPKLENKKVEHSFLNFYNTLVAYGSAKKLALSFTEEDDDLINNLIVCPPLIRPEIKKLETSNQNFILSYVLNDGYCEEIINWAKLNPEKRIEAFWDKKNEPATTLFGSNLTFHQLSGSLFINFLKDCSLYVSTAGFESICEAAYLQKNILMVPTANHYEQQCNAVDAKRAQIAQSDNYFNIDLGLTTNYSAEAKKIFRAWVDNNSNKIIDIITDNSN